MRAILVILATFFLAASAAAEEHVSFPTSDGGTVFADGYGAGERGVVLAHGGRFNKESWEKQARALAEAGFHVMAIDLRGYGKSTGPGEKQPLDAPLYIDVLAAVRYLHKSGAKTVSVVGGSMGGGAAANAAAVCEPGEIDRIVMLGSRGGDRPEEMKGRKLYIVSRDDIQGENTRRLPDIQADFDKTPGPKELIVLDGSAHAQFIFATDQGERAMREILRFLSEP